MPDPAPVLNGAQKRELLRHYFDLYRPEVVVETGLYMGGGSCLQFAGEAELHLIDVNPGNLAAAKAACAPHRIHCWLGDSGRWLQYLLNPETTTNNRPTLFWLDAHSVSEAGERDFAPLLMELEAIRAWPHAAASVVLVDDLRMMGRPGWPTIQEVRRAAGIGWDADEIDDVLRLTPPASVCYPGVT